MIYVNNVTIVGWLVLKPELKKSITNNFYVNFFVLFNKYVPDPKKEGIENAIRIPDPIKVDCMAWGTLAEKMSIYGEKGALLCIEGHLEHRSFYDKHGCRVEGNYVVCKKITFLRKPYDAEEELKRLENYNRTLIESKKVARKKRRRRKKEIEEEVCEPQIKILEEEE